MTETGLDFSAHHPEPTDFDIGFGEALGRLYGEGPSILGASERAIVGRLFLHLHAVFPDSVGSGHVWDLEYAHDHQGPKGLERTTSPGAVKRRLIPDLIWHRRRQPDAVGHLAPPSEDDNRVCIEVKIARGRNAAYSAPDLAKLAILTGAVSEIYLQSDGLTVAAPPRIDWPRALIRPESITAYRLGLAVVLHQHWADVLPLSGPVGPVWEWQQWRPRPVHKSPNGVGSRA